MSTTATNSLLSVSRVCALLGVSPSQLREAATAAGVQPAMTVDHSPYFAEQDLERLRAQIQKGR